jgi:hypothetical protein
VPFEVIVVVTVNITDLRDKLSLPWLRRNLQFPSFSLKVPEVYSDLPTVWIFFKPPVIAVWPAKPLL